MPASNMNTPMASSIWTKRAISARWMNLLRNDPQPMAERRDESEAWRLWAHPQAPGTEEAGIFIQDQPVVPVVEAAIDRAAVVQRQNLIGARGIDGQGAEFRGRPRQSELLPAGAPVDGSEDRRPGHRIGELFVRCVLCHLDHGPGDAVESAARRGLSVEQRSDVTGDRAGAADGEHMAVVHREGNIAGVFDNRSPGGLGLGVERGQLEAVHGAHQLHERGVEDDVLVEEPHRVPAPRFRVFPANQRIAKPKQLAYPLLVKSLTEEASLGIAQASLVTSDEKLKERVTFIHKKIGTDAIAEQYIHEREWRRVPPGESPAPSRRSTRLATW